MAKIKKERDVPHSWKYYRQSTGVALGRYLPPSPFAPKDDILIGLYAKGGGCRYEFRVAEHDLMDSKTISVRIFSDSFEILDALPSFFVFLTTRKPKTLDEVEAWCSENRLTNGLTGKKVR